MQVRTIVASLFAAPSLAVCLHAQQELWVDPVAGSDVNLGSYSSPLRTLGAAVNNAGPGDRIQLRAGVYGTASNGEVFPITFGAMPQQGLVVRGIGDVVFDLNGLGNTVFRMADGATGMRLTHIAVVNTAQTDPAGNNWWVRVISSGSAINSGDAALDVEIDRCRFEHINRGLVLWTADNVTGWRVHDNLFVDCANDAVLEYSGTNDFYNNTFFSGTFKAIISDSQTSHYLNNLVVDYSIVFENNVAGTPTTGRYEGNLVHLCGIVAQGVGLPGGVLPPSNLIGIDPLMVAPFSGDYRLQPTSPAVDAGVAIPFARGDFDANSRIVDGDNDGVLAVDIGCHEVTPLHLDASWDAPNSLVWMNTQSSAGASLGVVAFCFDDGVVQLPGQGPILIDATTYVPVLWASVTPGQLAFPIFNPPVGARLVMFVFGLVPAQVGSAFVGGNQVWLQL